jgi:hypothetical protein
MKSALALTAVTARKAAANAVNFRFLEQPINSLSGSIMLCPPRKVQEDLNVPKTARFSTQAGTEK